MKKPIFTIAIVLLAVMAQAQTAFKVHSNGQISLQSGTVFYGIQIPTTGVACFEPNITSSYGKTARTEVRNTLAKAWSVGNNYIASLGNDVFYVLGNGNVYSYGQYTLNPITPGRDGRGYYSMVNASELISGMKGYYMDSYDFEGVTPEQLESSGDILPESLEGILEDFEKGKTLGMNAEELETVLPEAVRHDPEGRMGINYSAIVPVLIEAFKEQQARIDELESILRENHLLK